MKNYLIAMSLCVVFLLGVTTVDAQRPLSLTLPEPDATDSADFATESAELASPSAEELQKLEVAKKEDITRPEEPDERSQFLELFKIRPVEKPAWYNFFAYSVQYAVKQGVPANTIILILLLPFLATGMAFSRHIVGLPTLGILFPLALSITLLSTGLITGTLLLTTIIFGSIIARMVLKKLRIMHMPKLALSMLLIALFVLSSIVVGALSNIVAIKKLSIFPVLLIILLSEQVVALHLERQLREIVVITFTNLMLGGVGFLFLSSATVQNVILLYPEFIFLLIPLNIAIGRYFGLRVTEFIRFKPILQTHGSKQ
ncbi:hypothetical protein HY468_04570 [Candidatus Roizmanbacteria bacterium]|nr:hypothetical protein [Candidatus Roizmanbacteria bacterium]